MSEILIHRAPVPADRFMIVTNAFMRGELPVPLKALPRVLLGYFLSLPTGWRVTRDKLDESVLEGRDAVDKALRDLESAGYLQRRRRRGEAGTWNWTYAVTDDPEARPLPSSPSPESQGMEPTSGNSANSQVAPSPGNPAMENQGIRTEVRTQKEERRTTAAADATDDPVLPLPGLEAESGKRAEEQPKQLTVNQLAVRIAQRAYDRAGGLVNMGQVIKLAKTALGAGYSPQAIDAAMQYLHSQNWRLTADGLRQQLEGGPRRPQTTTGRGETRTPSGHILEFH